MKVNKVSKKPRFGNARCLERGMRVSVNWTVRRETVVSPMGLSSGMSIA